MFQLQALKDVEQLSQGLAARRSKQSDENYNRGVEQFQKAVDSQFTDTAAVKAASQCFAEAIRCNQRNPEPYLALAYLLLSYGQQNQAIKCLRQVLYLKPNQEQAIGLLEYIQNPPPAALPAQAGSAPQMPAGEQVLAQPEQPAAEAPTDYDRLYDELKTALHQQAQFCMQVPAIDLADPQQLEYLKYLQSFFENSQQTISHYLEVVEQEFDTSELRVLFKPLEIRLRQIRQQLQASEKLQAVAEQVSQASRQVNRYLRQAQQPGGASELNLEQLLDLCDQFADQLDALDAQGHDIQVPAQAYSQLIRQVESLQDLIDD